MILSTFAVILTFGLVIFLHELGHFILCRRLGVKVERFAFGFGPELFGFTRGETRYSVCAIPMGGFVKPAGENPEESSGKPDEYFGKPWHQRLVIVAAGPGMNYLLAWGLFSSLLVWRGEPYPSTEPVIGDLAVAYPAEKAGLREGDRILALDGSAVETWSQLAEVIHKKPGLPVRVEYRRSEEKREVHVTPIREPNGTRGLIGIAPQVLHRPVPFLKAAGDGLRQCWFWTQYTVTTLAAKIVRLEKPELAGPVGIMQMIGKAAHSGLEEFLGLVGLISVAVGFFNLLPIPLLDGGHAAMYLWEGLTRRRLTAQAMSNANTVGLAFLLGVLLFATYQDLSRIRRPPWKQEAPKEESAKLEPPASAPPVERPAASK